MKNTKKISLIAILIAGLTLPMMQSCKKYPDGPGISMQSRTERVANTWAIENYKKNGNDYTSLMSDYNETFTKGGDYSWTSGIFGGNGIWEFQNNDKEIRLTGKSNQDTYTLFILRLEEKEFWYYYMDGDDKKEFHMIQK